MTDEIAAWQKKQRARTRRAVLRERAVEFLGGKCSICSYDKHPAGFDFHHVNPREKDFTISSAASWKKIEPELLKCVLLCSNCHREVHAGLHPGFLEQDGSWEAWELREDPYSDESEI